MSKNRVIVNYSSAFGLPGVNPDAGLAMLHLLISKNIIIEAVVLSGQSEEAQRVSAAFEWLLRFSGRSDVRVINALESGKKEAAESLLTLLYDSAGGESTSPVLLDIGDPSILLYTGKVRHDFFNSFSSLVFWTPSAIPHQRKGKAPSDGSFENIILRDYYLNSSVPLVMFNNEIGYLNPFDFDSLISIRSVSKPLYYLLKEFGRFDGESDYLYRLPAAVYLSNPELFNLEADEIVSLGDAAGFAFKKGGRAVQVARYITDINAYNKILDENRASLKSRRILYEI